MNHWKWCAICGEVIEGNSIDEMEEKTRQHCDEWHEGRRYPKTRIFGEEPK